MNMLISISITAKSILCCAIDLSRFSSLVCFCKMGFDDYDLPLNNNNRALTACFIASTAAGNNLYGTT
jgi:hypothetical protein